MPVPADWQEYIRLGIDYGTGYLKLAVQHIYPGRDENSTEIHDVCLDDLNNAAEEVAIEQVAVWTLERGLIWGARPVKRWTEDNPEDKVIKLSSWKLVLMKTFQDRDVVRQTIKALGSPDDQRSVRGDIQSLITEHMRQIKVRVLEWCEESHPDRLSRRPNWGILPWVSVTPRPQHDCVRDANSVSLSD
jgi:hypothetical protein